MEVGVGPGCSIYVLRSSYATSIHIGNTITVFLPVDMPNCPTTTLCVTVALHCDFRVMHPLIYC